MSTRTSAGRYAKALLDVAIKESSPEQADQELKAFQALVTRHPDLQKALTHPTVPPSAKRAVVERLLDRQKSSPAGKLLVLLADRDRLALLPELVEVYGERLTEYQRIVRAEVTTAQPMSEQRTTELQQRLAKVTGRPVQLTTKVDPAIIGGAVTRIGSTVYDGSVATQLQTIRQRLAAQN